MMDWTETESCIKCNGGGELLVCNENGCPISVHRDCMGCPAQFDDMDNFYCPYCLYKRAMTETRQLRDKAILAKKTLSTFLDEEMTDGNHQKLKTGMAEEKELTSSTVAANKTWPDRENSLKSDDENHSIHLEEHEVEKGFASIHTTTTLACEDSDELLVHKRNDGLLRCGEIPGLNDCDTSKMMVVYQPHSKPIVACGVDRVLCKEEMETHQPEIVDVGKRVRVEHPTEVDECQDDRVAQDQPQARHLSAVSIEKETLVDNVLILSSTEKRKPSETINENEEHIVEEAQEATVASTHLAPEPRLQSKSNRGLDDSDSTFRDNHIPSTRSRNVKQKLTHVLEPQNGNSTRRLSMELSSEAITGAERCGETIISSKSGQLKQSSTVCTKVPSLDEKRRKYWSIEEEDMLKEGLQKFATANKNIPWRKILEFGRHVFDTTRTSSDLKDKWRKHLAKKAQ